MKSPVPENEAQRLEALRRFEILDTPAEKPYNDIVLLALHLCQTPIAMITFVDAQRLWFKAKAGISANEAARTGAFCAYAILEDDILVVPDALKDERFASNVMVIGDPNVRFYAGVPLITDDGLALGVLCVMDRVPRELTAEQANDLRALARLVMSQLELRRSLTELECSTAAQRRSDEAVRQAEGKYKNIFQHAVEGIYQTSPDGRIIDANPALAHIFGFSSPEEMRAEITSIPRQQYVDPRARARFIRMIRDQGIVRGFETQFYRKDGNKIWVSIEARAVRDEHGNLNHYEGFITDITERKRIEEMKSDFVALVSHQLRTPVGILRGYIDNMLEGITGRLTIKQKQYLEKMKEINIRNYRLISDILSVLRFERGVVSVIIDPVKLKAVVEPVIESYREKIKKKGLKLQVSMADDGASILADKGKLIEVLSNLADNALKFTREGTIKISTRREDNWGVVEITDTGKGIAPETLKALFSRDQAFSGWPEAESGWRLGLYIARHFMQMQQGEISAISEVGKGSTFTCKIPLAK